MMSVTTTAVHGRAVILMLVQLCDAWSAVGSAGSEALARRCIAWMQPAHPPLTVVLVLRCRRYRVDVPITC